MPSLRKRLPDWVILNIPHDAVFIPHTLRKKILLTDVALDRELLRMTDFWTQALFSGAVPLSRMVIAPVSRLVVDNERFTDDSLESMASRGMGVIYTATSDLDPLRKSPTQREKENLLRTWYEPHHNRLERLVDASLKRHGKALIVDCHSFPSKALHYEKSPKGRRPEICLGTDTFHTPKSLQKEAYEVLSGAGFDVAFNAPFSGALTPLKHYRKDPRVASLMIEVRRDLYEDESSAAVTLNFPHVARLLQNSLVRAVESF